MTAVTLSQTELDKITREAQHACANFRSAVGQALSVSPEQTAEVVQLVIDHYKVPGTASTGRPQTREASGHH
jgi:hypothetical protein